MLVPPAVLVRRYGKTLFGPKETLLNSIQVAKIGHLVVSFDPTNTDH